MAEKVTFEPGSASTDWGGTTNDGGSGDQQEMIHVKLNVQAANLVVPDQLKPFSFFFLVNKINFVTKNTYIHKQML